MADDKKLMMKSSSDSTGMGEKPDYAKLKRRAEVGDSIGKSIAGEHYGKIGLLFKTTASVGKDEADFAGQGPLKGVTVRINKATKKAQLTHDGQTQEMSISELGDMTSKAHGAWTKKLEEISKSAKAPEEAKSETPENVKKINEALRKKQ